MEDRKEGSKGYEYCLDQTQSDAERNFNCHRILWRIFIVQNYETFNNKSNKSLF